MAESMCELLAGSEGKVSVFALIASTDVCVALVFTFVLLAGSDGKVSVFAFIAFAVVCKVPMEVPVAKEATAESMCELLAGSEGKVSVFALIALSVV